MPAAAVLAKFRTLYPKSTKSSQRSSKSSAHSSKKFDHQLQFLQENFLKIWLNIVVISWNPKQVRNGLTKFQL